MTGLTEELPTAALLAAIESGVVIDIRAASFLSGPRFTEFECSKCSGSGERTNPWRSFTCPSCGGTGRLFRQIDLPEDKTARGVRLGRASGNYRTGWR